MALPKEATPLIWKKRWSWAGVDENGWGKDIEAKSMNNMCKGTTVSAQPGRYVGVWFKNKVSGSL